MKTATILRNARRAHDLAADVAHGETAGARIHTLTAEIIRLDRYASAAWDLGMSAVITDAQNALRSKIDFLGEVVAARGAAPHRPLTAYDAELRLAVEMAR